MGQSRFSGDKTPTPETTESVTVHGKTKSVKVMRRSTSFEAPSVTTGGLASADSRRKQKQKALE